MPTVYLSPLTSIFQFFNDTGIILAGGKVNTYVAGTSTPQATYTDSTGAVSNSNPIILGSNGRFNNVEVWQPIGVKIKAIITDANNNQIGPTLDQLSGINDPSAIQLTFYGGTDTGSANNYVLTFSPGFASYTNGQIIYWVAANTNTGASTINVNGLGAISIVNQDGSTLVGSQIQAGSVSAIAFQGGKFVLLLSGNTFISPLVKTSTTIISSSTSLAADPDLSVAVSAGSYSYEFVLNFYSNSGTNGGIVLQPSLAGVAIGGTYVGYSNVNSTTSVFQSGGTIAGISFSYAALSQRVSAASSTDSFYLKGSFTTASAATFALYWAQKTSSSGNATMGANSLLTVVRGQVV